MTTQEYIQTELQRLAQPVHLEGIGKTPIEDAIFARAMSKKFRKFHANDTAAAKVKLAIQLAVQNKEPVKAKLVFGGNKLWRFEEAPEVDWAELFAIVYYVRWLKYISGVYEQGAYLEFFLQDIAVRTLNNLKQAETNQYYDTFKELLNWLRPYIPKNIILTFRRQSDLYDNPDNYYKELEAGKTIVLKENHDNLPKLDDAHKMSTELNVRLLPGQADDPHWREKVELEHQAIFRTSTLGAYLSAPGYIPLSAYRFPGLVAIGGTKRSYAKFWASVGALEQVGNTFHELLLTPKQLEASKFKWEPANLNGLSGKNFSKIRVLKQPSNTHP